MSIPSTVKQRVKQRGFSLIELVIVMVMIAVIAALAIPRVARVAIRSDIMATHDMFLTLERGLDLYHIDHQAWPTNTGVGVQPAELDPYLMGRPMESPPPLGGRWDWNGPGTGVDRYGFNVAVHRPSDERREAFDRAVDDGQSTSGDYRRDGWSLVRPVIEP